MVRVRFSTIDQSMGWLQQRHGVMSICHKALELFPSRDELRVGHHGSWQKRHSQRMEISSQVTPGLSNTAAVRKLYSITALTRFGLLMTFFYGNN